MFKIYHSSTMLISIIPPKTLPFQNCYSLLHFPILCQIHHQRPFFVVPISNLFHRNPRRKNREADMSISIPVPCCDKDVELFLATSDGRKWEYRQHSLQFPGKTQVSRRQLCSTASLVAVLIFHQGMTLEAVKAVDKADDKQGEDNSVFGTLKSLFDPNEKTKSGKVLPKAYVKSAKEVMKTLRESLKEDPKDAAKFRRNADAAKESIRDYLNNWSGQLAVSKEESYIELESVFRILAGFYAKAGPSASLSDEVRSEILHKLDVAEEFL